MIKKFAIIALLLICSGGLLAAFIVRKSKTNSSNLSLIQPSPTSSPTPDPTPFPFQEMTIPYLRNRTYQSSLSNLSEVSKTSNYTSYLTSYTSDGLRINALLTKPNGAPAQTGWPAIIFIHGYIPPSLYQTQERYGEYVDFLARNGFVVFKIDLRGHGNSQGEAGGAYYSPDYIIDVLHAYSALESASFVNPSQIGLWGHSMAGNVIMRTLAAKPTVKAAVIWAGAVYTYEDMRQYGINDNSYRPPQESSTRQRARQQLFDTYGAFDSQSDFWKQVTPVTYLQELATSIQIHHATDDDVVNIEYSRNLNNLLNSTSVTHQLIEYSTGGHNISGNSFSKAMTKTVEFFKNNLQ